MSDHAIEVVPEPERFPRAIFVILFFLALGVRFMGMMMRGDYVVPMYVGGDAGVVAHNIADGFGFSFPTDGPTLTTPATEMAPAYPYFLALLFKLGLTNEQVYYRAIFLNLFFAALLPAIVLAIGQAASFPRPVSLLAGIAMCFCPEGFAAPAHVWDEAIFVTLTAMFAGWMVRQLSGAAPPGLRTSAIMGAGSGLLALINPAMVLAFPAGWLAGLVVRGVAWRRVALHGILFVVLTLVASSPWHIRNWFLLKPAAPVFVCESAWFENWNTLLPAHASALTVCLQLLLRVMPALLGIAGLLAARRRIAAPVQSTIWCLLAAYLLPCNVSEAATPPLHPIDGLLYLGCAWFLWVAVLRRPKEQV